MLSLARGAALTKPVAGVRVGRRRAVAAMASQDPVFDIAVKGYKPDDVLGDCEWGWGAAGGGVGGAGTFHAAC